MSFIENTAAKNKANGKSSVFKLSAKTQGSPLFIIRDLMTNSFGHRKPLLLIFKPRGLRGIGAIVVPAIIIFGVLDIKMHLEQKPGALGQI